MRGQSNSFPEAWEEDYVNDDPIFQLPDDDDPTFWPGCRSLRARVELWGREVDEELMDEAMLKCCEDADCYGCDDCNAGAGWLHVTRIEAEKALDLARLTAVRSDVLSGYWQN